MSIPELNKVIKLQDEPNSNAVKPEKSDNAPDVAWIEKETVRPVSITATKSIVVIDSKIENSKNEPPDLTVWTQFGPTYRLLQTPEYPLGPEGFVHPKPKTAQGGYPSSSPGGGGYPSPSPGGGGYPSSSPGGGGYPSASPGHRGYPSARGGQSHAYPGGQSPAGAGAGGGGKRYQSHFVKGKKPPPDTPDKGEQEQSGEEEGGEEEEEPTWKYTPETKNRWLLTVFSLYFCCNAVTTILVIAMEELLSDFFEELRVGGMMAVISFFAFVILMGIQFRRMLFITPPGSIVILCLSVPLAAVIVTFATCYLDTIMFILVFITRTITAVIFCMLLSIMIDFNTWCMYCLVPMLSICVCGCLYCTTYFVLGIQLDYVDLFSPFVLILEDLMFVFVLQYALQGTYQDEGDEIYAYLATSLFLAPVIVALIFAFIYVKLCGRRRRRRRRRRRY